MLVVFVITGIISAVLMILAVKLVDPAKGRSFREFLISGSAVMGRLIRLIMLYAPIELGAYFAYLIGVFGSELAGVYFRVVILYYPVALLYFGVGLSFYAFVAAGRGGVKRFWTHILPPVLTA